MRKGCSEFLSGATEKVRKLSVFPNPGESLSKPGKVVGTQKHVQN